MKRFLAVLLILAFAQAGHCGPTKTDHLILVIFENTSFSAAYRSPTFRQLAGEGALLNHYSAVTHPSQPNYVALFAGDTMGVTDDSVVNLSGRHLGDLFEDVGLDWRIYAEAYPGGCFTGKRSGAYVRKHNPLMSFNNVNQNPTRCAKITDFDQFQKDLNSDKLQEFSFVVPDMDGSGHDTGIGGADSWLKQQLLPLMKSAQGQKATWIITFDEGTFDNTVYTLFFGAKVKVGVSSESFNHYSLLRTIEEMFALGSLNRQDAKAKPITGIWLN